MRREKLKRYLLGYQRPASTGKKAPITSTHKKIEENPERKKSQERIISNSYVVKHSLKNLKNITIEINTLLLGSL